MATAAPAAPAAPAKAAAPKPRFMARLRYARMSARKMRYVVDLIRGKDYNSALAILRVCSKRAAPFCKKLLESAAANALDFAQNKKLDLDANALHLVEAKVEGGPIIKRWRPSSTRRPTMIKKRMCHVTFVLEERPLKEGKKDRSKRQKQERSKAKKASAPKAAAPVP
ncbi:MAG TPA: 50S ribosomal protein L22, partial [Planctomycetota bacterium]|nr:50S ribosomal protein L22 [Planctomycetota bacterium]